MNIPKLAHIGIRVMDLRRTTHFYQQPGFPLMREHYEEKVAAMCRGCGLELNLIDNDVNEGRNLPMDMRGKFPGYTHSALRVVSIREAMDTVTGGVVSFGNGSTSIGIRDPDGKVIELPEAASAATEGGIGA